MSHFDAIRSKREIDLYDALNGNDTGLLPGEMQKRLAGLTKAQMCVFMAGLILPPKEAAKLLGIGVGRVKSVMAKARRLAPDLREVRESVLDEMLLRKELEGVYKFDIKDVENEKIPDAVLKLQKTRESKDKRGGAFIDDSSGDMLEIIEQHTVTVKRRVSGSGGGGEVIDV